MRLTPQLITSETMQTAVAMEEIFQTTHKIETDKKEMRWHCIVQQNIYEVVYEWCLAILMNG